MNRRDGERLEHRASHAEEDHTEHIEEAKDALWSEYETPTKAQLDLVMFAERRGSNDDESESKWKSIQHGMAHSKLDDPELCDFAVAAADYRKEAIKDILDSDRTDEYHLRDDLVMEKVYMMESTLLTHTLESIAERSHWYPFPGDRSDHIHKHLELAQMARNNEWKDIPGKLRELHKEADNKLQARSLQHTEPQAGN